MKMETHKDRRKNIYINKDLERKIDTVFEQMQHEGHFGALEEPDSNLAAIFEYAMTKAVESIPPTN